MSIRIMSQVWENGPNDKADILILLALADFCNDAGECWPSMASIARKARMTERGAQKIMARLVDTGWVEIEPGGGRKNCNLYRVKNPEPRSPRTTFTPNTVAETPNTVPKNPEPRSPEPSLTIKEPSNREAKASLSQKMIGDEFSQFWASVPRRVGRGAAEKAFAKARKVASFAEIVDGMARYARQRDGQDVQYTCHPATWLNQQRWLDEHQHTQADFHNEIDRLLNGGTTNGLPEPDTDYHQQAKRISAPVSEADAPRQRGGPDRNQNNHRGDQQSHLSLIKPRRFGAEG